jgi:dienelactone hydrolase
MLSNLNPILLNPPSFPATLTLVFASYRTTPEYNHFFTPLSAHHRGIKQPMPLTPQNEPNRAPDPFRNMSLTAVPSHQYKQGELIKINEHMLGYLCRPDRQRDDQRFNSLLIVGGSEGGISEPTVEFWAKQGYLSLGVAYHRGMPSNGSFTWDAIDSNLAKGVPDHLSGIELSEFKDALEFLKNHSFSAGTLATLGFSRGGELALILGVLYGSEIKATAAIAPSGAVLTSHSHDKATFARFVQEETPAWLHHGEPYQGDFTDSTGHVCCTRGRIKVEEIPTALFVVSGAQDSRFHEHFRRNIPDALDARRIVEPRDNAKDVAIHYEEAGHYYFLPDQIERVDSTDLSVGGGTSIEAIRQASIDTHTRLKEFLNRHHPS